MALKKTGFALMLLLVIAFSFIALIQLQKNNSSRLTFSDNFQATFSQPSFLDVVKPEQSLISNSTRMEVYNFIVENPGIQFRGVCSNLGIAIGTAEFHLGVLKKAGLIYFIRDGRYKRFFATKKYSVEKMKLISLLRHNTMREIVKKIIFEKTLSHSKLASYLCITSQGLTWQISRLKESGILHGNVSGINVRYSINEEYVQILSELIYMVEESVKAT